MLSGCYQHVNRYVEDVRERYYGLCRQTIPPGRDEDVTFGANGTSALDGDGVPRFSPRERTPGTHCTGGWVDPKAGLDTEATGKILCLCRGSNLDRPVFQPIARHYTDWATPLLKGLVDMNEIWYGGNAIQGGLDAMYFNTIASIILKLLTFKFVRWILLKFGFVLFMFHGNHGNQVVYCSKFN
jgi:hypothetical protein